MPNQSILYYVHDPMCSWCYAFRPTWQTIREQLPSALNLRYVVGGLAPDTDTPMPLAMQHKLQATWQRIMDVVPGTHFNFDFWTQRQARRATYPSCRAVLAAKTQDARAEIAMIQAIQDAYYQQARNPSDNRTLIAIAGEIGLDAEQFAQDLTSALLEQQLQDELALAARIGGDSFPSLILHHDEGLQNITYSYTDPNVALDALAQVSFS